MQLIWFIGILMTLQIEAKEVVETIQHAPHVDEDKYGNLVYVPGHTEIIVIDSDTGKVVSEHDIENANTPSHAVVNEIKHKGYFQRIENGDYAWIPGYTEFVVTDLDKGEIIGETDLENTDEEPENEIIINEVVHKPRIETDKDGNVVLIPGRTNLIVTDSDTGNVIDETILENNSDSKEKHVVVTEIVHEPSFKEDENGDRVFIAGFSEFVVIDPDTGKIVGENTDHPQQHPDIQQIVHESYFDEKENGDSVFIPGYTQLIVIDPDTGSEIVDENIDNAPQNKPVVSTVFHKSSFKVHENGDIELVPAYTEVISIDAKTNIVNIDEYQH